MYRSAQKIVTTSPFKDTCNNVADSDESEVQKSGWKEMGAQYRRKTKWLNRSEENR